MSDHRPENANPVAAGLREPLSTVAFWSAIALPALYLPLLAVGLGNVQDLVLFLGLFALHLAALHAGRSYGSR